MCTVKLNEERERDREIRATGASTFVRSLGRLFLVLLVQYTCRCDVHFLSLFGLLVDDGVLSLLPTVLQLDIIHV